MSRYRLDPAIDAWLRESERLAWLPPGAGIEAQRQAYARVCRHFGRPHPPGLVTEDRRFGGRPCRIYRPARPLGGGILWFHGGGWVVGDLDSHDSVVADLADAAGCVAVAVDYRLAPEHPFPSAFDDALAAYLAVQAAAAELGIVPGRLLLGGDSAGGNLAAAVSQACRDRDLPMPAGQLLVYPALCAEDGLPSRTEMADAPGLSAADMRDYLRLYLGRPPEEADRHDLRLHPGEAAEPRGLPPTFLTAAEFDPLASDVLAYAGRLRAAGVAVDAVVEAGLPHAWLRARHVAAPAKAAFARLVAAARRLSSADGGQPWA